MRSLSIISLDSISKFIRYFIIGGIAALTNMAIFFIFAKILQFNYLAVGALAFIVATFVNYILSVKYVFKSGIRFSKQKELFWVYVVSIIGLIENEVILYLLVSLLHVEIMISQIIAVGAVFFWNYIARNNFVFRGNGKEIVI
jgi:putative flippase GtrA